MRAANAPLMRTHRRWLARHWRAGMKYPMVFPWLVMATGALLCKRYAARLSLNSRMPTMTGSIDECPYAANVYRSVLIITE
jgi:hypothetical protein